MKVLKFGFFSPTDKHDMKFQHDLSWSRIYEYPFVLNEIAAYKERTGIEPKIHNCSWGFRDIHAVFKTWLDVKYNTYHSDLIPSSLYKAFIWDITKKAPQFVEHFDIVINVSTLEEVNGDHVEIMKNHLEQVKEGGIFIMTFDFPGLQLDKVEEFIEAKIFDPESRLNPLNSKLRDTVLGLPKDFNVGYLVIEK